MAVHHEFEQFLLNNEDFTQVKTIANGRFGEIDLIKRKEPIGEKNLFIRRTIQNGDVKVGDQKNFTKQLEFFFTVRPHPCITKFYGFFMNPSAIVVEYAPNGNLQKIWDLYKKGKAPEGWNNTARAKAVFGIAAAMEHLHSYGAIHRYLSLGNILLDEKFEIKLSDFGFAKMPYDETRMSEIANNPVYTAPEAMTSTEYDESVDVYSFGIIAFQLLTGKEPYDMSKYTPFSFKNAIVDGLKPEVPDNMDSEISNVLEACWDRETKQRPLFIDILRFLNTYTKQLLPDVDIEEYKSYTETILSDTNITDEYKDFFFTPDITPEKEEKFNEILHRSEETDDQEDLYQVGRLYDMGYGTVADPERAFGYYSRAAEKGHAISMYYMSRFLKEGRGTDVDIVRSTELLKQSSDLGFKLATLEYAKRIKDGIGIDNPEPKTALSIFEELAKPPYEMKEAMFEYGNLLIDPPRASEDSDQQITKNTEEGLKYIIESYNRSYVPAQMVYAKLLLDGEIVKENIKEGINIYQRAAVQNIPIALHNIGNCYESGRYGFPKDMEMAAKYYEKAAKLGLPVSMSRYGVFLSRGTGVDQDIMLSSYYFEKAAKLGDPLGCHNYASYLQNGTANVNINMLKAIKYYTRAGFPLSYYRVGDIYLQGLGNAPRDVGKAIEFFRKSANLGFREAQQKLDELT